MSGSQLLEELKAKTWEPQELRKYLCSNTSVMEFMDMYVLDTVFALGVSEKGTNHCNYIGVTEDNVILTLNKPLNKHKFLDEIITSVLIGGVKFGHRIVKADDEYPDMLWLIVDNIKYWINSVAKGEYRLSELSEKTLEENYKFKIVAE